MLLSIIFLLFLFYFFKGCTHDIWKFPVSGQIGAAAASLHHSHSNKGSEPHLWPKPQLTSVQGNTKSSTLSRAKDQIHNFLDTGQIHYHWATTGTPIIFLLYNSLWRILCRIFFYLPPVINITLAKHRYLTIRRKHLLISIWYAVEAQKEIGDSNSVPYLTIRLGHSQSTVLLRIFRKYSSTDKKNVWRSENKLLFPFSSFISILVSHLWSL